MKEGNVLRILPCAATHKWSDNWRHGKEVGELLTPFTFSNGIHLDEIRISYTLSGCLSGPVLAVLGGISAHKHVASTDHNLGWWESMVGSGKGIDSRRFMIIGMDFLAGADGSSSALDLNAAAGKEVSVSTSDQAWALKKVLDHIGVRKLDYLVGASFGGMVGLAFTALFPNRITSLICISASHESVPQAIALRSIQRRVVRLGLETGTASEALALARQLAMVTYRTPDELNQRFDSGNTSAEDPKSIISYLEHCGSQFADRFPVSSFLTLSEALDSHKVDPAQIKIPVHLIGIDSDLLVPFYQVASLARRIKGPVYLHKLSSLYGHDAFLKEVFTFSQLIKNILEKQS